MRLRRPRVAMADCAAAGRAAARWSFAACCCGGSSDCCRCCCVTAAPALPPPAVAVAAAFPCGCCSGLLASFLVGRFVRLAPIPLHRSIVIIVIVGIGLIDVAVRPRIGGGCQRAERQRAERKYGGGGDEPLAHVISWVCAVAGCRPGAGLGLFRWRWGSGSPEGRLAAQTHAPAPRPVPHPIGPVAVARLVPQSAN